MNQGLFTLIFNRRSGLLTPAWEGVSVCGKASSTARACVISLTLLFFTSPVWANPSGATVVNGNVGFAANGNTLNITNSPNAIIHWQSFSISKDEITRFIQQNGASAILNRITGQDPSKILGALQSNGRVFIINPNGIVFGKGANIDVAGLVASTLKLSDTDFLSGKYKFSDGINAGAIKNEGTINTGSGGQVYLIAPDIENNGIITSPKGEIVLAAGHSVSLVDLKNPEIVVSLTASATQAVNVGQLVAQGGSIGIYAGLVNQAGIVNANSASIDESGRIFLKGTQATILGANSVTSASNSVGQGGEIIVTAPEIKIESNASVDASGQTGGGAILVGGDTQGKNPDIVNARNTSVAVGARLKADALARGDGGKVVVWSDDTTRFDGRISARGGAQGGNGGFAEVSGKQHLSISGHADLSAPQGRAGTLLLDPGSVSIVTGVNTAPGGALDTFNTGWIEDQLNNNSNLIISTANSNSNNPRQDITVDGAVSWNSANSFTLLAGDDLIFNAGINNAGTGALNVTATNAFFNADTTTFNAGSRYDVSNLTQIDGATVDFKNIATLPILNLLNGRLGVNNNLTVATLDWLGGDIFGSGLLTTTGNSTLLSPEGPLNLIGASWNNRGTINISGELALFVDNDGNVPVFTNQAGGVVNSSGFTITGEEGTERFVNAGTLTLSSQGSAFIDTLFDNSGTVTLNSFSTLRISGSGTDTGTYNIGDRAALEFSGMRTWNTGVSFTRPGTLTINGVVNNNGAVNLSRRIVGEGIINNTAQGVITVNGSDRTDTFTPTLNNFGTLNVAGDLYTLELLNSSSNAGTLNIGENNTLSLRFDYANNGILTGKGMVRLAEGTLTNNGTIRPGTSSGTLTILGNLVLGATSVLDIDLGGTAPGLFDVINIEGSASLAGTVNALPSNGYVGSIGDNFKFLNAASVNGVFNTVNSPTAFTAMPRYGTSFAALTVSSLAPPPRVMPTPSIRTLPQTPPPDPTLIASTLGFSPLPNTGSGSGANNAAGTNNLTSSSPSAFNALLEAAPSAAIGADGNNLRAAFNPELYLSYPFSGDDRDARLLCR